MKKAFMVLAVFGALAPAVPARAEKLNYAALISDYDLKTFGSRSSVVVDGVRDGCLHAPCTNAPKLVSFHTKGGDDGAEALVVYRHGRPVVVTAGGGVIDAKGIEAFGVPPNVAKYLAGE